MKYDLAVAYRIFPGISRQPPVYSEDKLKLSELCLYSFKNSLGNLKVKLFVIMDNCQDEYDELFKLYFSEDDLELIHFPPTGCAGTVLFQIDKLLKQNDSEYIYFAEDDYFYLPGQFPEMLDLLKVSGAEFVTPYDHPDHYNHELHNYKSEKIHIGERIWKKIATTTMTFLTTKDYLSANVEVFKTHSKKNWDNAIWMSLTKMKAFEPMFYLKSFVKDIDMTKSLVKMWYFCWHQLLFGRRWKLYCPVPSIATHLNSPDLSPNVDWFRYFEEGMKGIRN